MPSFSPSIYGIWMYLGVGMIWISLDKRSILSILGYIMIYIYIEFYSSIAVYGSTSTHDKHHKHDLGHT
jgi:hypothetical protein